MYQKKKEKRRVDLN